MNRHAILLASRTGNYYAISPDEFSVAPVIMKDAECSLVDNLIAEKLILPTFRPDAPVLQSSSSRPEEDWSIRSKRRQDKFLCYQVVYKRTLSIFHDTMQFVVAYTMFTEPTSGSSGLASMTWVASDCHWYIHSTAKKRFCRT